MFFFFFSSRRRHTRFDCDWSSDVCSSDLSLRGGPCSVSLALGCAGFGRRVQCERGLNCKSCHWQLFFIQSEEHTSELQSQSNLVCRLLLEKKKKIIAMIMT